MTLPRLKDYRSRQREKEQLINFGLVCYRCANNRLCMTLPVPPSSNRLWRRGKQGRLYKDRGAAAYQAGVRLALIAAGWRLDHVIQGPVRLELRWYRIKKQGDTSNRLKVVEDALQGVAFGNDALVNELHVYRWEGAPARIEIIVESAARLRLNPTETFSI